MSTKWKYYYIIFVLTITQTFCCDYYDPDNSRPYSTIVCTNISSLSNIPPPTQNEQFDQFLEITQSRITIIPKSAFSEFAAINKLYLTQNHIKEISPGAFDGLENIRVLYLDLNELTEVSSGVYDSLKTLEVLNLANNKIVTVDKLAFKHLETLAEINLENNLIKKIEGHTFDSQKQLQLLDLSSNPLENFNGEGLSSLSALIIAETALTKFDSDLRHLNLEILNLSSSYIEEIDFSTFPKVEKIYLSNNELVSLCNLEKLDSSYISLDNNTIRTINGTLNDVSFVTLKHNRLTILTNTLFNESASVSFIDLSYNLISKIEKDAFRYMTQLQILHLEFNNITEVDPKLFADLIELKYLDLSHNQIKDLQYGTFNNLIQLKVLNMSYNKLTNLHENGFLAVISLEEILFDNNLITYMDVDTLLKFKAQLKTISLNHNAWDCESVAEAYVAFMTNRTINFSGLTEDGENFHGIACTSKRKNFWEDTEMSKFFNEEFKQSNFFQYFEKDYRKSDFFKFLEEYRNHMNRMEKLVSSEMPTGNSTNKILILSVVIQVIIAVLLLLNFWKKNRGYPA